MQGNLHIASSFITIFRIVFFMAKFVDRFWLSHRGSRVSHVSAGEAINEDDICKLLCTVCPSFLLIEGS